MKTNQLKLKWTVLCVSSLLGAGALRANADNPATPEAEGETSSGTIAMVDADAKTVKVKGLLFSKTYHVGDNCEFELGTKKDGAISDLRPGQKVTLRYAEVGGVRVANRIEQEEQRFHGTVKFFDLKNHTLTVKDFTSTRMFKVPDSCHVTIRDGKEGTLEDIKVGHQVSVIYESPNDGPIARGIEQKSLTHTGSLSAIDSTDRSIKIGHLLGDKRFNLADRCTIIVDGNDRAKLSELGLGDEVILSYEDVNGVNVVNRIERPMEKPQTQTATSKR
jgi:Cu/Ag efflux protein CusF